MNKKEAENILIVSGIEPDEAAVEVQLILESILGITRETLILQPEFDGKKVLPVLNERAKTRRPVQYILGYAYFMKKKFFVDETVLIPRDETEILVLEAFSLVNGGEKILDIGTGSGAITCMLGLLGKNKGIEILGVDISTSAICVALKNMKNFGLQGICLFRKSDIFSSVREDEKFNIIVSNPPYIPKNMKSKIQKEVLYEPEIALFTDDEKGLYFYRKIIQKAPEFLKKGGWLLFELMEGQSDDAATILADFGFKNIETVCDLAGIKRVIKAQL